MQDILPSIVPDIERATQAAPPLLAEEEIEEMFLAVISQKPTQPLIRQKTKAEITAERHVCALVLVFLLSTMAGAIVGILTSPTVTITLEPVSQRVSYTAPLTIPTRTLAPVTLTKTAAISTTGHARQPATRATGILTFYNGRFAPQTVPQGSTVTGQEGVTVALDTAATTPAATTQGVGIATVSAHAIQAGPQGNLPALSINLAVSSDLLVKNLTAFTQGHAARTYQAVAPHDLESLSATLTSALSNQFPQAFPLHAGEALVLTHCVFAAAPNHKVGEEAVRVTVVATATCQALAYDQETLQQQATSIFLDQTRPGAKYTLVGAVIPTILTTSPLTVAIRGLWVYTLSQSDEQALASHIAGESPQRAKAYLLRTGFIRAATVSQSLPRDPEHIQFLVLIGH